MRHARRQRKSAEAARGREKLTVVPDRSTLIGPTLRDGECTLTVESNFVVPAG